jgi:hypothetical protein
MSTSIDGQSGDREVEGSSQRADLFMEQANVRRFIENKFAPGNLKIQEAGGEPVSPEIQEQILLALPEFLTQMALSNSPINEEYPKEMVEDVAIQDLSPKQLEQLSQPNKPQTTPSTYYLRPDVINTREAQAMIKYTQTNFNREHREFGRRIWIKLVEKALKETKAPHAVHPFQELHQFNGMIVGLPSLPKYGSYQEMMKGSRKVEPKYIIRLADYEIANNLLTDKDKAELYTLAIHDKTFQITLKSITHTQAYIPTLITHLPMTWELIDALAITPEQVIILLSYKLQNNLLDDHTVETIKEIAGDPANKELIGYLLSVQDQLAGTPLGEVALHKEGVRNQAEELLALPFDQEEDQPHEPTILPGQPFNLDDWKPDTDTEN